LKQVDNAKCKPQKLGLNTSRDLQCQQLTMTGVAGAEDIQDGLAAPRRPPPKHSMSLARIACVT